MKKTSNPEKPPKVDLDEHMEETVAIRTFLPN